VAAVVVGPLEVAAEGVGKVEVADAVGDGFGGGGEIVIAAGDEDAEGGVLGDGTAELGGDVEVAIAAAVVPWVDGTVVNALPSDSKVTP
jgi:hypothetical protein